MNNRLKYLLFFYFIGISKLVYGQTIDCDNSVYISTHISTGTDLYKVQIDEERGIYNLEALFTQNTDYQIGCMGYSVVDKMIYAIELNTHEVLRINAEGAITNLGVPKGFDTTLKYYSGDIFPSGRDLFAIGQDPTTAKDVAFYSIDVFDLRATPLALVSDGEVTIQDMARNPLDGNVFGYDSKQGKVITINLGQVNNYQLPSIPEQFTALFFDKKGNLYGHGDSGGTTSRKFFQIDKIGGHATLLTDGPIANDSDACSCPYTFQFYKKMTPKEVLPCQEITIEYTFFNSSGSARTNLSILDELPEELEVTSIEFLGDSNKFNARINGGLGTNMVDLSRIEVLLGAKNKITVKAIVLPETSGLISSQAVLTNLPLALNPNMISDNVETNELDDPNLIEILSSNDPVFEDQIVYDCENATAIITAPFTNARSFRWEDGSTNSTLTVDQPGTYTVQMETDCGQYVHTTTANFDNPERFVDLGPDRTEDIGSRFLFNYETNMSNIAAYEWNTDNSTELNCIDCPTPTISLLDPTTFYVTITDAQGCIATDEISIDLNTSKQIYAPTVFSPNGDGINDRFFLQGKKAAIIKFGIHDRWGNQMYQQLTGEIGDNQLGWDGRYQGKLVESGVFIWYAQINFPDGTTDILSGTIALIR